MDSYVGWGATVAAEGAGSEAASAAAIEGAPDMFLDILRVCFKLSNRRG